MLTRRGLLTTSATLTAAAIAGGAAACTDDPPATGSPGGPPGGAPPFDPNDWASVRGQFALDPTRTNFAAFYFASHPATVRAAIDRHRAGLDANPIGYMVGHEPELDAAVLSAAASYLRTEAGQIALTDSTTMGLGLLYTGIRLAPGDEVLTTEHDFYATHESLALRTARDGAAVRRVRLYDEPERATAGPTRASSRRAVRRAKRSGWPTSASRSSTTRSSPWSAAWCARWRSRRRRGAHAARAARAAVSI